MFNGTSKRTDTLRHFCKQWPQSLADLTYRVIKTPMMHSLLSSLLICLVPLTSVSIPLSVSFQSLSLFTVSHYSLFVFLSTSFSLPLILTLFTEETLVYAVKAKRYEDSCLIWLPRHQTSPLHLRLVLPPLLLTPSFSP